MTLRTQQTVAAVGDMFYNNPRGISCRRNGLGRQGWKVKHHLTNPDFGRRMKYSQRFLGNFIIGYEGGFTLNSEVNVTTG